MAAAVASPTVHPIQRPLKGSRISSFYPVKELPPLSALDSAFQLQEYISLLIRKDVHDVDAIVSIPGKGKGRESSEGDSRNGDDQKDGSEAKEVAVDEACWIYEQLRRLAQDLSHPLITMLQQECTRQTCPEMKAGEWLYLCVAHGNEGAMEQCCAIDYILHTLDSATALLNSPRAFPSRLSIPAPSHRHFSSLARRLGRIFAHAYFHHRAAFAQAEAESALYARFLALTSRFNLVPAEFLVIPPGIGFDDHQRDQGRDPADSYPRLLAASIDQQYAREPPRAGADDAQSQAYAPIQQPGLIRLDAAPSAPPAERQAHDPSPKRVGRNRTDTMVHSEIASVVEELGRSAAEAEAENRPREEPVVLSAARDEVEGQHEAQSDEAQSDEAQSDEAQSDETQSDETPSNEAQSEITNEAAAEPPIHESEAQTASEPEARSEEGVVAAEEWTHAAPVDVSEPSEETDDVAPAAEQDEGPSAPLEEIVPADDSVPVEHIWEFDESVEMPPSPTGDEPTEETDIAETAEALEPEEVQFEAGTQADDEPAPVPEQAEQISEQPTPATELSGSMDDLLHDDATTVVADTIAEVSASSEAEAAQEETELPTVAPAMESDDSAKEPETDLQQDASAGEG